MRTKERRGFSFPMENCLMLMVAGAIFLAGCVKIDPEYEKLVAQNQELERRYAANARQLGGLKAHLLSQEQHLNNLEQSLQDCREAQKIVRG